MSIWAFPRGNLQFQTSCFRSDWRRCNSLESSHVLLKLFLLSLELCDVFLLQIQDMFSFSPLFEPDPGSASANQLRG